jgi:hypothetical protein
VIHVNFSFRRSRRFIPSYLIRATPDPREVEALILEESSHAMAACVYGFRVSKITIEPDYDANYSGAVFAKPNAKNTLQQKLVVAIVGPLAKSEFLGKRLSLRSPAFAGDAERIRALLWDQNSNLEDPLRCQAVRLAVAAARNLLEKHKGVVEVFAHALRSKRTIFRREISALYQCATMLPGFSA